MIYNTDAVNLKNSYIYHLFQEKRRYQILAILAITMVPKVNKIVTVQSQRDFLVCKLHIIAALIFGKF